MTGRAATPPDIALLTAIPLPGSGSGAGAEAAQGAPDWVQLLPAGTITTVDGRGPYTVRDPAGLAKDSLAAFAGRLPIDENHATDLAAPQGGPSPARGWIVELAARADGIWGRVEWTETGLKLLADKAYRFLSPVIRFRPDGAILQILRAALTNRPNLRGMAALNSETTMDVQKLRAALGLKDDAEEAAIVAAVTSLKTSVAAQAAGLAPIAKAAGLKEDAAAPAILAAVTTLAEAGKAGEDGAKITALQAELTATATELKTLRDGVARDKATAAVDKELAGLPSLTRPSGATVTPPERDKDGKIALNAEQRQTCKVLGIAEDAYQKTLAAEAAAAEAAAA